MVRKSRENSSIVRKKSGKIILVRELNNMNKKKDPNIAPGMDDQEELNASATEKEVEDGEYTSVTTLSYDEVDPS
jgi:hypothetical protein